MNAKLHSLYRYPMKGMTGERLESSAIQTHGALPGDRIFAIAKGSVARDGNPDHWVSKDHFVQLTDVPRLAQLDTSYDTDTGILTIKRNGRPVTRSNLSTPLGRAGLEDFLSAFLKKDVAGATRIVAADGFNFTDAKGQYLSLINLKSVEDFGRRIAKTKVDPGRFRANLWLEDLAPWEELEWLPGTLLTIGGKTMRVVAQIPRCAATDINPATAERDLNIPRLLMAGLRHVHLGVYVDVLEDGVLSAGDPLEQVILPEIDSPHIPSVA